MLYFLFHGSIDNNEKYENDEEWVKVSSVIQFNKVVYLFSGDTFLPRLF